ncbi:Hint domain-containing protein [Pseudoalteromonas rubra]|uniref:Hint domain-containing protein n=1 Tax=Pseudoalteromonas rubra TaxID=43658 RepID=UPI000F7A1EC9|nr:Hint domain-containing protein [Pseudoalteromonas rubra]
MKLVSLAVAAALGGASFASVSAPMVSKVESLPQHIAEFQQLSELEQAKQRLARHGITEKNRPFLFRSMRETINKKKLRAQTADIMSEAQMSTADCSTGKLCSFFKHMGIRSMTRKDGQEYLVLTAVNSELSTTYYTLIDLTLMNEKGEELVMPSFTEYFGQGTADEPQKRVSVASLGRMEDVLPKLVNSERIFADAYVTVSYQGPNGDTITENRSSVIEYSPETLLADLGVYKTSGTATHLAAMQANTAGIASTLPPGYGRNPNAILENDVIHPVDVKERNEADPSLNRIKVCLNRKYNDCDYEAMYDPGTPNDQLKLLIPFSGYREVMGEVKKIYTPDFHQLAVTYDDNTGVGTKKLVTDDKNQPVVEKPDSIHYGSEIFIQTREGGGASRIGDDYQGSDSVNLFSDYLTLRKGVKTVGGNEYPYTRISWNIPRNMGVFGDATLYGRYQDAHWIMNLAVEVEQIRRNRPMIRHLTYVIGSSDMPESNWKDIKHPPMQVVYSCLAKGSMITLANGKHLPIEHLSVGDTVLGASQFAPDQHMPLEIEDISVGVELIPMVKLTTASGKTLLLTESHPVVTVSGLSAWANKIKTGDQIRTESGVEMITAIEEVKYNDNVYNLKLKRAATDETHVTGETFTMFANGLQVGDLAMQGDNEFSNGEVTTQDVLNNLPEAWHQDYLNSLKD